MRFVFSFCIVLVGLAVITTGFPLSIASHTKVAKLNSRSSLGMNRPTLTQTPEHFKRSPKPFLGSGFGWSGWTYTSPARGGN
ncbi:hypothetical protein DFH28DRAFT_1119916 [Melampsora americana]|nr:hypothetical protein DFH28DRAFT_1119916 [Melampsora americana]